MSFSIHEAPARAQLDTAFACFERYQNACALAHRLRHQLHWAVTSDGTRLHRIDAETGQLIAELGPRCDALEQLHDNHHDRRSGALSALAHRSSELRRAERQNIAAGVSRVPPVVIRILDALRQHGLLDYYRVIGTYALFAYEAAAKVVLSDETTATNDVDLLWDIQARLSFVARFADPPSSMIDVLRVADPTFERNEDQKESAINASGFSVDFLRRREPCKHTDAFPISGHDGDVYPVQAGSAQLLLNSPCFDQVVVGTDGRMALMRTIDPVTFVHVKRWLSQSDSREFIKRGRDRRQADVVQSLLDSGLLRSTLAAKPA